MPAKKESFLTKEGYEKLVQELHELKTVKLPQVLTRLGEAKAMGDLSENFEYKSSLEDREIIASRMNEIEELLDNVEIIKEKKKKGNSSITYGSKVKLELADKKKYEVTVVGTGEVEINDTLNISLDSPLGQAIKGKKAGDKASMKVLNEKQNVKILEVK